MGFQKRQSAILTIPLDADSFGWIGLNRATGRGSGVLEINPVVGIRNQAVERLLADLVGEPFNELTPPTLAGNVGYLSPDNRYVAFLFGSFGDVQQSVERLCSMVQNHGLPFCRDNVELLKLVSSMLSTRFGVPEQLNYRIPVACFLAGERLMAMSALDARLDDIGSRADPAALRYRAFAQRLRERLNR